MSQQLPQTQQLYEASINFCSCQQYYLRSNCHRNRTTKDYTKSTDLFIVKIRVDGVENIQRTYQVGEWQIQNYINIKIKRQ